MDAQQKIRELTQILDKANYEYYVLDAPTMSDFDYDRMLRSIAQYEEKGMSRQQAEIEAFYANTRS